MTTEQDKPLDWQHPIKGALSRDLSFEREATADEREQMRSSLDVVSLDSFTATYTISSRSNGCFNFEGTYSATLTQACVVTLEPIAQVISEPFLVSFCPPHKIAEPQGKDRPVLGEPDVEPLKSDSIDAGRVLFELLSANIDPYPRKEDVEFVWRDPKVGDEEAKAANPFAALQAIKTNNNQ